VKWIAILFERIKTNLFIATLMVGKAYCRGERGYLGQGLGGTAGF